MLKRQNIKDNLASSSGKVSCSLLLLLTCLMINPTATSASALEGDEDVNHDDQISAQADDGVTISFTPTSGSASITPITSAGSSAKINVSANVQIASTGGYSIYLSGKNAALTGMKTGQTIAATTSAKTFANLSTNTWGYAAVEGSSVSDSATYSALPQGQGVKLGEGTGNATNVNRTFALSFAAKIGDDKPADTYSNQVTLSVTSSPRIVAFTDYTTTMQGMTSSICSAVDVGTEAQLRDTRDGKYYWVAKLADGKCWMTQNLDLDLSTSKTLTMTDSDVPTAGYKPTRNTDTTASSGTVSSSTTSQYSWSLGDYRITNSDKPANCGYKKASAADCAGQLTAYTTPTTANGDTNAHYILGNHYQWNTVTAGTGSSTASGQAVNSICPKGWRLPTSGSDTAEFGALATKLGGTSSTDNLTKSPFYAVRGGNISYNTSYLYENAGDYGFYLSSTAGSSTSQVYTLRFNSTNSIIPANAEYRAYGLSVRCVAR